MPSSLSDVRKISGRYEDFWNAALNEWLLFVLKSDAHAR